MFMIVWMSGQVVFTSEHQLESNQSSWVLYLITVAGFMWEDAVETKAFMSIGIFRDEAESMGLSLSHHRL